MKTNQKQNTVATNAGTGKNVVTVKPKTGEQKPIEKPAAKQNPIETAKPGTPSTMDLNPKTLAAHFNTDAKKIRVALRKHKIQKNDDGRYGWSKSEYEKIIKTIAADFKTAKPDTANTAETTK